VSKSLSVQRRLAQDSKAGRIAANIAKLPELLKKEDWAVAGSRLASELN
jgi:hypothetical protein